MQKFLVLGGKAQSNMTAPTKSETQMCGRSRMHVLRVKGAIIQRDQCTAESPTMISRLGLSFLVTIIGHLAMRLSDRNLLGRRASDKSTTNSYL